MIRNTEGIGGITSRSAGHRWLVQPVIKHPLPGPGPGTAPRKETLAFPKGTKLFQGYVSGFARIARMENAVLRASLRQRATADARGRSRSYPLSIPAGISSRLLPSKSVPGADSRLKDKP